MEECILEKSVNGKFYRVYNDLDKFFSNEYGYGVVPCEKCSHCENIIKENLEKSLWGIDASHEYEALEYFIEHYA